MATNPARPPTIWEVADRFRAELEARERVAAGEMIRAWQPVRRTLLRETGRLAQAIAERQAQGRRVPVSWLFSQARLGEWETRVKRELAAWRKDAEPAAAKAAREAATLGPEAAMEMVAVRAIPFPELAARRLVRFPREEVAQMVATVQEGSPLHELLGRLGPETAAVMRETLVRGIALGSGPVVMGRELATALDGNLRRGLLIARTETMRTFRETTRLSYAARPDVVGGWRWWSSRDRRTCAACYAMHGTLHPVEERLDGHPACRCTMIPELAADTGLAGPTIPTGERLFEELDAATQRSILGPGRFRLYENGEARLSDMVARPVHPRWGSMRREANLRDVRANAEARRAGRPTPATMRAVTDRPAPIAPRPGDAERAAELRGKVDYFSQVTPKRLAELERARAAGDSSAVADIAERLAGDERIMAPIRRELSAIEARARGEVLHEPMSARFPAVDEAVRPGAQRAGELLDKLLLAEVDDSVLGLQLTEIAAIPEGAGKLGTLGQCYAGGERISLRVMETHQTASTMLHEVGHRLDFALTGERHASLAEELAARAPASPVEEAMQDAVAAMARTPTVQRLLEQAANPEVGAEAYQKYVVDVREVWARAFEQWVETRTGAAAELRWAKRVGGQWPEDEFAGLVPLIDRVMREAGWLRSAT